MKTKITKILCLVICMCVLCTMLPVHAAELNADNKVTEDTNTPDTNPEDQSPAPESEVKPINLKGSMYKKRSAQLKWNADNKEATYNIYRSTSENSGFKKIGTKKGVEGSVSYNDLSLTVGTIYYYKIKMVLNGKTQVTSNTVSVRIRLKPPTNIKTTITSNNDVKLTWDKASYATNYIIYRSNTKKGTYTKIANTSKTEYVDKTASSAESYYYRIRSWKKNYTKAQSLLSEIKVAYTKTKKPTVTVKYASSKVTLSWKKVTRADKYYIYKRNSKGDYEKIGETSKLTYSDKNVSKNKHYYYKVRGVYKLNNKTTLGFYSSVKSIYTNKIDPNKKMVALTFDDGPSIYTKDIVDCLKENGGHATFFVIGNRISTYADEMKYAYDNGNEIANHTYSHPTLTSLSVSKVKSEVSKTDDAIKKITGETPALIRAPGGATNSTVRNAVSKPFIYWSIDTLDWKHRNSTTTVNTVMNNVKDGDIVLMHDIHGPTKTAALTLIPKLKKAGYQLVTVSELAQYRGYTMQNGTTYYSFR